MSRNKIEKRVYHAAHSLLHKKGYISPVDLLLELGWLTEQRIKQWRFGEVSYLERVVSVNLRKLNFALKTLRKFTYEQQLKHSTTSYKSWGKGPKRDLRFSKSGQPHLEKRYRTHYVRK